MSIFHIFFLISLFFLSFPLNFFFNLSFPSQSVSLLFPFLSFFLICFHLLSLFFTLFIFPPRPLLYFFLLTNLYFYSTSFLSLPLYCVLFLSFFLFLFFLFPSHLLYFTNLYVFFFSSLFLLMFLLLLCFLRIPFLFLLSCIFQPLLLFIFSILCDVFLFLSFFFAFPRVFSSSPLLHSSLLSPQIILLILQTYPLRSD